MTNIKVTFNKIEKIVVEYEVDENVKRSELYDKAHTDAEAFINEHLDDASTSNIIYQVAEMDVKTD